MTEATDTETSGAREAPGRITDAITHGDAVLAAHIRDERHGNWRDFKAPKGKRFVLLLLGTVDKDATGYDVDAALNRLGWTFGNDRNPCDNIFSHKWLDPICVEGGCQSLALSQASKLLKQLILTARTTGGTAGPDTGLMAACEEAETFLVSNAQRLRVS